MNALMIVLGRFSSDQTGMWRLVEGLFFETEEAAQKRAFSTGFTSVKVVNLWTHTETVWDAKWPDGDGPCKWVERVALAGDTEKGQAVANALAQHDRYAVE